jgi:hypothetical protein
MARMAIQCRGTSSMTDHVGLLRCSSGCAGEYRRRWVRRRRCWVATKPAMTDFGSIALGCAAKMGIMLKVVALRGDRKWNQSRGARRAAIKERGKVDFSIVIRFSRAKGRSRSILPGAFRQCWSPRSIGACPASSGGLRGSGRGGRSFCFRTLPHDYFAIAVSCADLSILASQSSSRRSLSPSSV